RSTRDYHLNAAAFRDWLERLESQHVTLWNPQPIARWNMEKLYLRDLEARGIPIVPTAWVSAGSSVQLEDLFDSISWDEVVVKPAIAASAYRTFRVTRAGAAPAQSDFAELCQRGIVL